MVHWPCSATVHTVCIHLSRQLHQLPCKVTVLSFFEQIQKIVTKYCSGRIHWCLHHLPTLPAQVVTSVMSTTMTNWLHSLLDKQYISCASVISTAHMTVYICEVMGVGSVYCEMWFEGLFLCICIKCINCSLYPGAL